MKGQVGRPKSRTAAPGARAAALALALGVGASMGLAVGGEENGGADGQRAHPAAEGAAIAPGVARVLALEGDPVAGASAYASCAVCHRPSGHGRPDGTFPQLAGQHREVVVKQLVDIREGRRRNPVMAPYAEALMDDQEIADVAAYIESLAPPEPDARGGADASGPPVGRAAPAPGAALYRRDCSSCHGPRGEGNADRFVPVLGGQHEAYLLRQVRAIAAGRRGNAHPVMQRGVAVYDDAELRAVIRYAAGLPGPRRERGE